MEEVLPHIAKRVLLLILLWILPFFIADLFIDKNFAFRIIFVVNYNIDSYNISVSKEKLYIN